MPTPEENAALTLERLAADLREGGVTIAYARRCLAAYFAALAFDTAHPNGLTIELQDGRQGIVLGTLCSGPCAFARVRFDDGSEAAFDLSPKCAAYVLRELDG